MYSADKGDKNSIGKLRSERDNELNAISNHFKLAVDQARRAKKTANDALQPMKKVDAVKLTSPLRAIIVFDPKTKQPTDKAMMPPGQDQSVYNRPSTESINDMHQAIEIDQLIRLNIFGPTAVTGFMPKIGAYADGLCKYALAMKLYLDQHHGIDIHHIINIANKIIDKAAIIFNRGELTHYVYDLLQNHGNATIDKKYSVAVVAFIWHSDDTTSDSIHVAPNISNSNIIDILKSILQSATAVIHQIDTAYLNTDEVFLNNDFTSSYDEAFKAFETANEADNIFETVWLPIIHLKTAVCPLNKLQQALYWAINAKNAAVSAKNNYRCFTEYFQQFIPTIQVMLDSCKALDELLYHTPVATEGYTYLSTPKSCLQEIKKMLDTLNQAINQSDDAAKKYNASYERYHNFCNAIK